MTECSSADFSAELEDGAPEHEIEVTLEMIKAGSDFLAFYKPEYDRLDETVTQIFRAMYGERS
jgi:hypothetical protein